MTDATTLVFGAIAQVAPEVEPELPDLDRGVDLWQELGLDSMDHLSVMTIISESTGREIPERDYPLLTTLDQFEQYLTAAGTGSPSGDSS